MLCEPTHKLDEGMRGDGVEAGCGLVEEEETWPPKQLQRHRETLPLTTRKSSTALRMSNPNMSALPKPKLTEELIYAFLCLGASVPGLECRRIHQCLRRTQHRHQQLVAVLR